MDSKKDKDDTKNNEEKAAPSSSSSRKRYAKGSRVNQTEAWNRRFEELRDFYRRHGHSDVPSPYPENEGLSRWVKRQRWDYQITLSAAGKYKKDGDKKLKSMNHPSRSTMPADRIVRLMTLNFTWNLQERTWEETYSKLLDFKKQTGHTNVPSDFEDRHLAQWVRHQRLQIRRYLIAEDGKRKHSITLDRIQRLYDIGFACNSEEAEAKWAVDMGSSSGFPKQKTIQIPSYDEKEGQPSGVASFQYEQTQDDYQQHGKEDSTTRFSSGKRVSFSSGCCSGTTNEQTKRRKTLRLSETAVMTLLEGPDDFTGRAGCSYGTEGKSNASWS